MLYNKTEIATKYKDHQTTIPDNLVKFEENLLRLKKICMRYI